MNKLKKERQKYVEISEVTYQRLKRFVHPGHFVDSGVRIDSGKVRIYIDDKTFQDLEKISRKNLCSPEQTINMLANANKQLEVKNDK